MERDYRQQRGGQGRTEQTLQVVGQPRERQGPGVLGLIGQDLRDDRLEQGRKARRGRLQHGDQHVDLPDLGDERQRQCDQGPDHVQPDQHDLAPVRRHHRTGDRREQHVHDHLDGQGQAEHLPGLIAGQVVGQQGQRHGRQARAQQGDDLGGKELTESEVGQDIQHGKTSAVVAAVRVSLQPLTFEIDAGVGIHFVVRLEGHAQMALG